MIINLLYDKNNIVRCSDQHTASNNLIGNLYTPKNLSDVLSWKYAKNNPEVNFTVISSDVCYLQSIDYEITGTYNKLIIETSIDYVNWVELPYKTDGHNTFLFIKSVSGINYYQNLSTKEIISDPSNQLQYVYSALNSTSLQVENLYTNYEFKYIRFVFTDVMATAISPLFFNSISIMIDEEIDDTYLKKQHISNRTSAYTRSKIYNTYNFIPEIVSNFSKMLETNNQSQKNPEYQNILLQQSVIDLIHIQQDSFTDPTLNLSVPIGQARIGFTNQVV